MHGRLTPYQGPKDELTQGDIMPLAHSVKARRGVLYTYQMPTTRLQPIRHREGIVFMERSMGLSEVGHVCLTAFPENREVCIEYFEVQEPFRGRGYGREIYEWIEKHSRRRGIRVILLTPYDSAIGFWRTMGFRLLSRKTYEMAKVLR